MLDRIFTISFHCYYPNNPEVTKHYQKLKLSEIPRWVDAYKFTHPNCMIINIKIWLNETHDE